VLPEPAPLNKVRTLTARPRVTILRSSMSELIERKTLADEAAIGRMLRRIANEVVERNGGVADLALVGIRTGGHHLAHRLRHLIQSIEGSAVPVGSVDITLYRDDVFVGLPKPEVGPTELPFAVRDVTIVLVDDVLFTGRTVRAALDALMDYGRPRAVQLAVLIDRGRRELPIRADYVGLAVDTAADESVSVLLSETDNDDRVVLRGPGGAA
jgi:pyrimidine operon attenuation protein/uracil phosphoribosyltransferase